MGEQILNQILEELQSLKKEQQAGNQRLKRIEAEQQAGIQRLDRIEAEQQLIQQTNMENSEKLISIKSDIFSLKRDMNQVMQSVLETNQDVKHILDDHKSILEVVGEHEVSIRTLRRKPV